MSGRETTFPMSDQMVWDAYYRHLADQGVMTNRQLEEWYAQQETTAEERRERPPEPVAGRRMGAKARRAAATEA